MRQNPLIFNFTQTDITHFIKQHKIYRGVTADDYPEFRTILHPLAWYSPPLSAPPPTPQSGRGLSHLYTCSPDSLGVGAPCTPASGYAFDFRPLISWNKYIWVILKLRSDYMLKFRHFTCIIGLCLTSWEEDSTSGKLKPQFNQTSGQIFLRIMICKQL